MVFVPTTLLLSVATMDCVCFPKSMKDTLRTLPVLYSCGPMDARPMSRRPFADRTNWDHPSCRSDRDDLRLRVGPDHNWRTAIGTKSAMGLTAGFARHVMKVQRALQKPDSVFRQDNERRERSSARSLAISAVTMKQR